jgi:ASC-1-like (ASCH) protein
MPRTKVLWIRDEYLEQILSGRKTVEVRVAYPNVARLETGDTLLLNEKHPYTIAAVRCYPTFEALAAAENPTTIGPDLSHPDDLVRACRALYPPEKEALGVVALEIAPATGHRDS